MTKRTFEEHWIEIAEYFEFEKVHKVMSVLGWQWAITNGVPKIAQIVSEARRLCMRVYESDIKSISTGGFVAEYDEESDILSLFFKVASWESYND